MGRLEQGDATARGGLERVREMALVASAAAGDWRRALLLLREREATGAAVMADGGGPMGILAQYSYAIEACARAGRGREALALLQGRAMTSSSASSTSSSSASGPRATKVLSNVLEALGSTGHVGEAFDLARPVLSSSSTSAGGSARRRQQQQMGGRAAAPMAAVGVKDPQQQHFLSKQAWNVVARGARARLLQQQQDQQQQRQKRQRGHDQEDDGVDDGGDDAGTQGSDRDRGLEGLLWALRAMASRGVAPGRAELDAALQGCAAAGQWEAAVALLRDTAESDHSGGGGSGAGAGGGVAGGVDVYACNRLLHAMAQAPGAQVSEEARALLALMAPGRLGPRARPDVISYTTVLDALGRAGEWEGAGLLLKEMEGKGDPAPNLRTYTVVMRAAARAGRWERCLAVLDGLGRRGVQVRIRWAGISWAVYLI